MSNYTTFKKIFLSLSDKLTNNLNFQLKFSGFILVQSYESDNYILLSFKSDISTLSCNKCGSIASRNKGYRSTYPLVGVYNDKKVICSFQKKIFYCNKCNKCSVQPITGISKNKCISDELINLIISKLRQQNSTYTSISKSIGLSISSVVRYFDNFKLTKLDYKEFSNIGIDEVRFIPSAGNYQCNIFDSETGLLIDVLSNRESKTVREYLTNNFSHIKTISQDLWKTYKNAALAANKDVTIIADMFHVVRTAMWGFGRTRIAHFKVNGNTTKLKWRTLNYSLSKLDSESKAIVKYKISKDKYIKVNHQAKEMFIAACKCDNKDDFKRIYNAFDRYTRKHKLKEYDQVKTLVKNWEIEILNSLESKISNGLIERRNSDFKQSKRNARGFRNLPRATKLIQYRINSSIKPELYNVG